MVVRADFAVALRDQSPKHFSGSRVGRHRMGNDVRRSHAVTREELVQAAERRWRQKIGYARARIGRLGWADAAHHTALEILGYRFNRGPMLQLAARHPLDAWARGATHIGVSPAATGAADG